MQTTTVQVSVWFQTVTLTFTLNLTTQPQVGDNVDANFEDKGIWYGGHITSINAEGLVGLQYANGDIELDVPPHRVRSQTFVVGDAVEVNCGGKGVWHAAELTKVHNDGLAYDVRYAKRGIKWISDEKVSGDDGQKHSKCLACYLLLGWVVVSRQDGKVVVRRPPQPLSPRGFAATRRVPKTRILPNQVLPNSLS